MTIQEVIAKRTEFATQTIVTTARAIDPTKTTWSPLDEGRTPLNILAECAVMAEGVAEVVERATFGEMDFAKFRADILAIQSMGEAITKLEANTVRLAAAIRAMPDDQLEKQVESPWATHSLVHWSMHLIDHNAYHDGQLNYIQTLYGDKGMH